jgi:hypothetical protein
MKRRLALHFLHVFVETLGLFSKSRQLPIIQRGTDVTMVATGP